MLSLFAVELANKSVTDELVHTLLVLGPEGNQRRYCWHTPKRHGTAHVFGATVDSLHLRISIYSLSTAFHSLTVPQTNPMPPHIEYLCEGVRLRGWR